MLTPALTDLYSPQTVSLATPGSRRRSALLQHVVLTPPLDFVAIRLYLFAAPMNSAYITPPNSASSPRCGADVDQVALRLKPKLLKRTSRRVSYATSSMRSIRKYMTGSSCHLTTLEGLGAFGRPSGCFQQLIRW